LVALTNVVAVGVVPDMTADPARKFAPVKATVVALL
jgi:hypothetical protein